MNRPLLDYNLLYRRKQAMMMKRKKTQNSDGSTQSARSVPDEVRKAIQLVESQLKARNAELAATVCPPTIPYRATTTPARSRFDIDYATAVNSKSQVKSTKAEMERNALFEQQQQNRQKELKKAEEKVKDKLAQIAREKLGGLLSKEKQLQLERKRKAMEFLNQIKGVSQPTTETETSNEKDKNEDDGNASDDSEASVHSIPITSYGPEEKTDEDEEPLTNQPIILPLQKKVQTTALLSPKFKEEKDSPQKTTTVLLSDDDDVQVISEIKAPVMQQYRRHKTKSSRKRRSSRSETRESSISYKRSRKMSTNSMDASSSQSSDSEEDTQVRVYRSKSHKSGKSKKKSSKSTHSKKKSKKKRSRSHSRSPKRSSHRSKSHRRSRSRSLTHRSRSTYSEESVASGTSHRRYHDKRSSHTPSKRKEKKRKQDP